MKEEKKEEKKGETAPPPTAAAASTVAGEKQMPWPLRDIKEPHEHDVLYGRGGGTNHHIGNKRYRKMVEDKKVDYCNSKRLDKPLVALNIIRHWREQDPPGRFLKLDEKTGLWDDVGDKKAREKTSQALREKAPELRKQQEVDEQGDEGKSGNDEELEDSASKRKEKEKKTRVKKTAFNVPEGEPKRRDSKNIRHLMLARDHSLGRDYLKPDERVDLDGFSWDEPVGEIYGRKERSHGQPRQERRSFPPTQEGEGWGSGRFANIDPSTSMPPPPPGAYASRSAGSAGEFNSMMPAPETHVSREHSLANNPLPGAAVDGPARNPFPREGKSASGDGLDESWVRGPAHTQSQPYGFPPPLSQTSSQSRFLSNEGNSAFSRTPSTQGGDRSRRSSESAEDAQHRSRSSSGRTMEYEYNRGSYHGSSRREWSNQSDNYQQVAGTVGDDGPHEIRRSWSGQNDEYTRGPAYPPDTGALQPPSEGHSYSGHDSWPSRARPYSEALREGGPPTYDPHLPPPPQPHSAPRHAPLPPSAPLRGTHQHRGRRESSDGVSVVEGTSHARMNEKVPVTGQKERTGSGKSVAKPNLRRKLSGGGLTPRTPQPEENKRGLTRPQPVKRDTSHQCENDETKSRVKRSFVSSEDSLANSALTNSDANDKVTGAIIEEERRMTELETTFQKSHLNSSKPSTVSANNRLTTFDAIGMAFADDSQEENTRTKLSGEIEKSPSSERAKPEAITPKNRLTTEDAIGMVFSKPLSLSEDQRLTSLGDPLDGGDLLIDPIGTGDVVRGSGSRTTVKPDRLFAKQRATTVDALLMEIEDEVDALSKPDALSTGQRQDTVTAITEGLSDDAIAKAWLDS